MQAGCPSQTTKGAMREEPYPDALLAGHRLHWYVLEHVLGQGGFGITYLARDTNLDRRVAIKEYLPSEIARRRSDAEAHPRTEAQAERYTWGLERFLAEARTLARFVHPNIVHVHSVFEANNTAYMVMRYEEGESLSRLLDRCGTLSEQQLSSCLLPILDGLQLVHAAGFIHRDIKPANIYMRQDGSPVLLDFGSARQAFGSTKTMTILIAPGYAPLEQYYSEAATQGAWTDIYSLGATCYRAIAGRAPLDAVVRAKGVLGSARDVQEPAAAVGRGRYSDRLLAAVDHALQLNEQDRPQDIASWRRELLATGSAPHAEAAALAVAAVPSAPAPVSVSADASAPASAPAPVPDAAAEVQKRAAAARWMWPAALATAAVAGVVVVLVSARPSAAPPVVPAPPAPPTAVAVVPVPVPVPEPEPAPALKLAPAPSTAPARTQSNREARALPVPTPTPTPTPRTAAMAPVRALGAREPAVPSPLQAEAPAPTPVTVVPMAAPSPLATPTTVALAPNPAKREADARAARDEQIDAAEAALRRGDHAVAAQLLAPWAAAGVPRAQALLGRVKEGRPGKERSDFEAYVWYSIAARGGDSAAAALRDAVAARLQTAEIRQAEQAIERWRPRPEPAAGANP